MKHDKTKQQHKNTTIPLKKFKKKQYKFIAALVVVFLGLSILYPWIYGKFYINVKHAYISTEVLPILSQTSGIIKSINVENDQYVNPGDLLLDLETTTYKQQLLEAKSELLVTQGKLSLAKFKQARAMELLEMHAISAEEYSITANSTLSLQENLQEIQDKILELQAHIDNAKVIANTAGWVSDLKVTAGDVVNNKQTIVKLVKAGHFWIQLNLTKKQLTQVHAHQTVQIKIENFPGHILSGVVLPNTGSTTTPEHKNQSKPLKNPITILINNEFNLPLRNGMHASVLINIGKNLQYIDLCLQK